MLHIWFHHWVKLKALSSSWFPHNFCSNLSFWNLDSWHNCSWRRFKFTIYFMFPPHTQQVFISCYQFKGNCNYQAILLWIQTLRSIFRTQSLSRINQTAFVKTVHSMWIHNTYYDMKLAVSCQNWWQEIKQYQILACDRNIWQIIVYSSTLCRV